MHRSSTVLLCYGAIPELDEASIRPTRDPPPGWAGDWAEAALLLAQDRDRIAEGMNDLVVHRLFAAGLALETALGLIGGHPGAGKVHEAIGELDLAIRDVRNVVFDHRQPDRLSGGQPAAAVVQSSEHVASVVADFRGRLGIESGRQSLEAKRWVNAASEVREKVLETGAERVDVSRRLGNEALDRARPVQGRLSSGIAGRALRRRGGEDEERDEQG